MDLALLLTRMLLAAVFAVAGLAKLADLTGSRQALSGFGVPTSLATPLGLLLPLAELAVAVALIPRASAWWGALGALALLLLFVASIGVNLARGRAPDCHCFGQLHSAPAGWSTLARNAALAAAAAFVLWQGWDDPGLSPIAWLGDLSLAAGAALVLGLLALLLLAVAGWALLHLLRQHGRLLLRLDALEARLAGGPAPEAVAAPAPPLGSGLPVGAPAPAFSLPGLHGETLTLEALRAAGQPVLLLFSDPNCGPCNTLLPEIGRWQREHAGAITVALVTRGQPEANRAKSAEHAIVHLLLQADREVAQTYQANGTPAAVLVRPDGTIGSPLALGADAIRSLVVRTVGGPAPAPSVPLRPAAIDDGDRNGTGQPQPTVPAPAPVSPQVGQPAPALRLPDLDGTEVDLASFIRHPTLVLFWNPGCGFCTRMLDALKGVEAEPPAGAPQLLVISTGDAETNRAMGLRSPVLLDQGFAAGRAFGARGTPSAVLLDAEGKIASTVEVGAPAVLAVARGEVPDPAGAPGNGAGAPNTPAIGDPAPAVELPDLSGRTLSLSALRGTRTLVLFWNPGCGFCIRMLDDLKAWEAQRPKGAPKLLVVSTGSIEANRAMGLRSPVLLDEGFSTGTAFGASGTPSAVLVDAKGKIASEIAVGAPAVLALAGATQEAPSPDA